MKVTGSQKMFTAESIRTTPPSVGADDPPNPAVLLDPSVPLPPVPNVRMGQPVERVATPVTASSRCDRSAAQSSLARGRAEFHKPREQLVATIREELASHKTAPSRQPIPAAVLPLLQVRVEGTEFKDALGRTVLLRGVNAGGGAKTPPFFPFPFKESGRPEDAEALDFSQALEGYLDRVCDWGMNVIRVPFTWEAVEPQRGTYDEVYLDRLQQMVAAAQVRGLRVVLDCHQDLVARAHGGDGFPRWAVAGHPLFIQYYPDPLWGLGYSTNGNVKNDLGRFWRNDDGLQDSFCAMWRHVAQRLGGMDGVVGLEVFNEPNPGNAAHREWCKKDLTDFYSRMAAELAKAAPGTPVYFDPTGLEGVTHTISMDRPTGDGLVFAPHFYDGLRLGAANFPVLTQLAAALGTRDVTSPMGNLRKTGDAWNVPVFVGEFGIPSKAHDAAQVIAANFDALDHHLLSGAIWEYSTRQEDWNGEGMSLCRPDGTEVPMTAQAVRAYPEAVAGQTLGFFLDATTRCGWLRFMPQGAGPTEIRLPARLYPHGVDVALRGGTDGAWSHDPQAQKLVITTSGEEPVDVFFGPRPVS